MDDDIAGHEAFRLPRRSQTIGPRGLPRIEVSRYRDLPLGTVDASVIAAAERLGISEVATVDRRHFSVVRPRHAEAFTLLL
jgi:predicted nucleic acid-binding protein